MRASARTQQDKKAFCAKCFVAHVVGLAVILGVAGAFLAHLTLGGTFGGLIP